jgi:hypothetical protein
MATATTSDSNVWVRQFLKDKGYSDDQIGYDQKRNMVTAAGQDFFKPAVNVSGKTYGSMTDLNSAWDAMQKKFSGGASSGGANASVSSVAPQASARPATSQPAAASVPAFQMPTFNYNPATDQRYIQALQLADQNATQATGNAMAALAARGIDNSSIMGDRAAQIQQQERAKVTGQLLPQLYAQAYDQFANDVAMRYQLWRDQTNDAYRAGRDQVNDAFTAAQLTGYYLPPEARGMVDRIIQLGEAWKTGTPEQRTQYHQEANRLRAQLAGMGIDPSLFGADRTTEERLANLGRAGIQTLDALNMAFNQDMANREFEYRQARDRIADEQWKMQFDEDVRRYGLDYALRKWQVSSSIANANADNARAAASQNFNRLMDIWRATGKAPQGIPGVAPGTPYGGEGSANAFEAQILAGLSSFSNSQEALGWLRENAGEITRNLGADGYQRIQSMLPSFYGEGQDNAAYRRQQATEAAMRDPAWGTASPAEREAMISEYMRYF